MRTLHYCNSHEYHRQGDYLVTVKSSFDSTNVVKIEALWNATVMAMDARTLNVTWNLPARLQNYNVSVLHSIQLIPQQSAEELNSSNVCQVDRFSGLAVL